jgi:hypothetical protein
MVKAGLVRRTRDRKDRRAVFVTMTDKGKAAVEPAAPAGWEFMHKLLSPLSYDEQRALAGTLERIKCELIGYLNPEMDMAEIIKHSFTDDPDLYKRLVKNVLPPGYEAERKRKKKWISILRPAPGDKALIKWFQFVYYLGFLITADTPTNEFAATMRPGNSS